jgi:NAD(P)-dependent dehydrogenase (short-subunit alcohol dehydrogenase family)
MKLEQRAVLVTGASRGLGAALAKRVAHAGARVVAVARGGEALQRLVTEIRASGGEAHALVSDIGDKAAIHPLAGAAAALVGDIDVVVHNASTLGPTPLRLLLDTECEDLERVLAVNLVGPFRLTRVLAGSMALRKSGVIVHVSSDASVAAYPRWGAYSLSKAALDPSRLWAPSSRPASAHSVVRARWTRDHARRADAVGLRSRDLATSPRKSRHDRHAERISPARDSKPQPGDAVKAADWPRDPPDDESPVDRSVSGRRPRASRSQAPASKAICWS